MMKSTSRIRSATRTAVVLVWCCLVTNLNFQPKPCLGFQLFSSSVRSNQFRLQVSSTTTSTSSSSSTSSPSIPKTTSTSTANKSNVKQYKDQSQKNMEAKLLHLSRRGQTSDALSLYQSIWDLDDESLSSSQSSSSSSRRRPPRNQCKPTTRLMNHAIDACARSYPPRVDTAFDIFHTAIQGGTSGTRRLCPNVYTFGALVSVCGRAGMVDKCTSLIQMMKDEYKIKPNSVVYSTAISACERCTPPQPQLAIQLLQEATIPHNVNMDGTLNIVGYNAAISACAKGGEWKLALQLLDEMEGGTNTNANANSNSNSNGNNSSHNHKSTKSNQPWAVEKQGQQHVALLHPDTQIPRPDVITYGTVMAACERSDQWRHVLSLAEAMEEKETQSIMAMTTMVANDSTSKDEQQGYSNGHGWIMDGMAITSALHACQRLGLADDALRYLEKMKSLGDVGGTGIASNSRGPRGYSYRGRKPLKGPDEVAYNLAISACARAGMGSNRVSYNGGGGGDDEIVGARWEDGIRLLEEMEQVTGKPPNVVAYTAAIGGCAEAGKYMKAFEFLKEMKVKHGINPNVVTFSTVISACANASAQAAARVKDDDTKDTEEIRAPMKAALSLLAEMTSGKKGIAEPNVVTYNAAIKACAEGLDLEKAFSLLEELLERGLEPTIVTYGTLMTACERVGSVKGASHVFKKLNKYSKHLRPNEIIYGAAISCCRKASEPEQTTLLLHKMLKEKLSPNTAVFNTVLMSQAENKNFEKATIVYRLMKSDKIPQSARPNRQTYNALIIALALDGKPSDAEYYLKEMRKDGFLPDVDLYTATVTSYEKNREPLKAIQIMESMSEDGYDFYEVKVLNDAFKKAIKLVNVVGQGFKNSGAFQSNSTELESNVLLDDTRDLATEV